MRRPRVYVAGPINGSGRQFENLRRAIDAGLQLMELGVDPFVPHLNLLMSFVGSQGDVHVERWQTWDDNWLNCCDAVLRLPGASPGSDHEEALARRLGKPVMYSIPTLMSWVKHHFHPTPVGVEPERQAEPQMGDDY